MDAELTKLKAKRRLTVPEELRVRELQTKIDRAKAVSKRYSTDEQQKNLLQVPSLTTSYPHQYRTHMVSAYFEEKYTRTSMSFQQFLMKHGVHPTQSNQRLTQTVNTRSFGVNMICYLREPTTKQDDFDKLVTLLTELNVLFKPAKPGVTYIDALQYASKTRGFKNFPTGPSPIVLNEEISLPVKPDPVHPAYPDDNSDLYDDPTPLTEPADAGRSVLTPEVPQAPSPTPSSRSESQSAIDDSSQVMNEPSPQAVETESSEAKDISRRSPQELDDKSSSEDESSSSDTEDEQSSGGDHLDSPTELLRSIALPPISPAKQAEAFSRYLEMEGELVFDTLVNLPNKPPYSEDVLGPIRDECYAQFDADRSKINSKQLSLTDSYCMSQRTEALQYFESMAIATDPSEVFTTAYRRSNKTRASATLGTRDFAETSRHLRIQCIKDMLIGIQVLEEVAAKHNIPVDKTSPGKAKQAKKPKKSKA